MPVCIARRVLSRLLASRTGTRFGLAAFALIIGCDALQNAVAEGDTRTISLHHVHTKEDLTITYKRNGRYDPAALKKINWLLRDWRRDEEVETDPLLLDLVWEAHREVGATQPIHVICGYRAPQTNAMLRRRSEGVAQFSQHTQGRALDFFIPGASLEELRNIGLRLQRGGIGFYPTSGSPFVHLDVGNVRHWPAISREELVRIFPDGRTVHIPSDGRPLAGYTLAQADIERRGGSPSAVSLDAARVAGVLGGEPARRADKDVSSALARFLGFGSSNDVETTASINRAAPAALASAAKAPTTPTTPMPRSRPAPVQVAAAIPPAARAPATPPKAAPVALASAVPVLPEEALAYAPLPGPELERPDPPTRRPVAAAWQAPAPASIPLETSIAVMQPAGKPALVHTRNEIQIGQPFADPWLRAAILAPNLYNYMTAAAMGPTDAHGLNTFMQKPSSSVAMAFSDDPNFGLSAERFSGRAVVFIATVNFRTRTALLQ